MFLRKYWFPLLAFIVSIVGVCLYILTTQFPQAPVAETSQGGHFHEDGTFHTQPHETEAQPTAEVSQPQPQEDPTVIAQGKPNANSVADTQPIDAEKMARYQQRVTQYREDYNVWWEKRDKANTEWVQAGETLDNIGSRDAEEYVAYVRSLSGTEKREHVAKLQDALEKYRAASEKYDAVMKEKPVPPTTPQND